ncbi:uncharacterized protein Nmag_3376 [Natrialba magadii ATCC 43099]|uniref:DUF5305 domain-containing protein n=1 Tax=Natrialba magadii (strain ATCC 43099 / DSM 3394 / CCM 3739 / CIP 104546 / IAM 13178 / JCM 8861 / NBRC 102185 / NCIMB 2190 / MS3) TaxID=547559 RepID=D3ST59_NATMM|nr:DUF5305 domain-containing protein [Natrialba magadii]ADD06926.1 uncharacterized protein Nmag_3376 [Natrialba magadii ATCC 43099]
MKYHRLLLVLSILAIAAGLWIGYGAYVAPGEATEEQTVLTTSGEIEHRAVVSESNSLYPTDTVLENEPLYYTTIAPTVEGEFHSRYGSVQEGNATVTHELELVIRSVDGDETYWMTRSSLGSDTGQAIEPGEETTTAFEINMTEVQDRISEIESDLEDDPGESSVAVETTVTLEGVFDGEERTVTTTDQIPVQLTGGTYSLDDDELSGEQITEHETESATPVLTRAIGGPLLLLGGLVGTGGLVVFRPDEYGLSATERAWLAYRDDRAEFDAIIATLSPPEEAFDRPRTSVDSLAKLVQVGSNTDSTVVYDPTREVYVVVGEFLYVFEPPQKPDSTERGPESVRGSKSAETKSEHDKEPDQSEDQDVLALPAHDTDTHTETISDKNTNEA